jgi:hypothetical protein
MTAQTTEATLIKFEANPPSAAALAKGSDAALEMVKSFEIVDAPTYELAGEELVAIKRKATQLEDQRKTITKPMDDAKKAVMDLFRKPLDVLAQAEGVLKGKMLTFSQEQARRAAEARAQAEAQARQERERLEREAAELQAQGRAGEAAAKTAIAQVVSAAQIEDPFTAPVKASGVKTTTTIDYEVVDLGKLVAHVAKNPQLLQLLTVDSVRLRAHVRAFGLACDLDGVRVFEKQGLAASRK